MKKERLTASFAVLFLISAVCSGYIRALGQDENQKDHQPPIQTNTKITKDVLRQRLNGKNVNFIGTSPPDKPNPSNMSDIPELVIKEAEIYPYDMLNPLLLRIKIINGYRNSFKAQLYGEEEYDFEGLVSKLNSIFRERETNAVYRDGTNIVEKKINLAASDEDIAYYEKNKITVEDFERLIDDLHKKGIDEISVDFVELRVPRDPNLLDLFKPAAKTISGGVLNEKAVKLVEPSYPSAAKSAKASGQVMVRVTVDEQGNVVSAKAVSGHRLLKASAVRAALSSKFSVTMLSGQPVKVRGIIVYNFTAPK